MPLTKIENINHNSWWALWEINESNQELLTLCRLSTQDNVYYNEIKNEIKRKELLAGRLAVKSLAQKLDTNFHGIQKDQYGKPFLINSSYQISISHSYPYAAAIIHKSKPVGIDMEKPQPKLSKIARKFLSNSELHETGENLEKLCVFWCAKETLYKIHGRKKLLFKENLGIGQFTMHEYGNIKGYICLGNKNNRYNIHYRKFSGYIITYNY